MWWLVRLGAIGLVSLMSMIPGLSLAQERASAVLVVDDGGYEGAWVTHQVGTALYGRFLEAGPYARVHTVVGRQHTDEGLAAALREAAASSDVVDVFMTVHTTTRDPERWRALLPAEARKLRLVYSTACYGAQEERAAWKALGARAVVTHQGLNDPLIAMPYVLSRWVAGAPIGQAVAEGYRETQLATALAVNAAAGWLATVGTTGALDASGCRPVISGDGQLTVATGLSGARPACPPLLTYSRRRGGPVGLALRAMSGRVSFGRAEAEGLLQRAYATQVVPAEALAQLVRLGVGLERGEGRLELALRDAVNVPLPGMPWGIKLRVAEQVTVRPGVVDVVKREVELHVRGLALAKGFLRLSLKKARLFVKDGQVRVKASAGLFGFIPIWKTFTLGPSAAPPADDGPVIDTEPAPAAPASGLKGQLDRVGGALGAPVP